MTSLETMISLGFANCEDVALMPWYLWVIDGWLCML
jgi:hypothetical protein